MLADRAAASFSSNLPDSEIEQKPIANGGIDPVLPTIDPENLDDLYKMAKEHVEGTKLGEFHSAYQWPFEAQVVNDFKQLYDRLMPLFNETDRVRKELYKRAFWFRFSTFFSYVVFLCGGTLIAYSTDFSMSELTDLSDPLTFAGYVSCVLALGFVFYRRATVLPGLEKLSASFGSFCNNSLNKLYTQASYALANVNNDRSTTAGCGERATKWSFVAMWLFQLHSFLDRYVTTASWRVQTEFKLYTYGFRIVKTLFFFGFLAILFFITDMSKAHEIGGAAVLAVLMLGGTYLGWDMWGKPGASNNLFADNFTPAIAGRSKEEIVKNHVNTKIAKTIGFLRDLQYQSAES